MRALVGEVGRGREIRVGSLREQLANRGLGLVVVTLAEVVVAHVPRAVDQVLRRPVLVVPRVPRPEVVVERDRVPDPELLGVVADVRPHPFEGELRCVDADDREAARPVALVPLGDVGERAQAVDAGVRPEVDQDDPAAELGQRQRLRVEPADEAGELRRRAVVLERARSVLGDHLGRARSRQLLELVVGEPFEPLLNRLDVVRHLQLQVLVEPERHCERSRCDENAADDAKRLRARAKPCRSALAREGDRQHRQGGADGEGEREPDSLDSDLARRGDRRDRGENGSGARDEHQPEARAEQEAAAEVARAPSGQALKRPGDELADLRHEQRERDEEKQRDRQVAEEVIRQADLVEEPRCEEGEDGEADDDPRDDRERTPARRAAGEHDREHR